MVINSMNDMNGLKNQWKPQEDKRGSILDELQAKIWSQLS